MRMSLPGSCGLPGSVHSSSLPLPLVSSTNGAQPWALTGSPVSSSTAVLIQPATGPVPAHGLVGVVAELRMVGAEAGVDHRVLHGLRVEHRDLPPRLLERKDLGGGMVRALAAEG